LRQQRRKLIRPMSRLLPPPLLQRRARRLLQLA
jgi:hypothetical protein